MKKILFIVLLFISAHMFASDGLCGDYYLTSISGNVIYASIEKTNRYKISVNDNNYGVVVYATSADCYTSGKHNYVEATSVMRSSSALGGNCRLSFYADSEGYVENIELQIDGITNTLKRAENENEHSSTSTSTQNTAQTTAINRNTPPSQTYQPVETRIQNISVTFGLNGNWTFRFYQTGSFECRTWYGQHGKWDTSYMRDFQTTSGTYYITKNQYGGVIVHLRFANGKNTTGSLLYKNGRAEFSYGGTYNMKCHKEM